jgi:autotransporter translocation and assembly factor TamB
VQPTTVKHNKLIIIIAVLLGVFLLLQGAILVITRVPFGDIVTNKVAALLQDSVNGEVKLERVYTSLFNKVVAEQLTISQDGSTVLGADKIIIHYSLWQFISKGFDILASISRIELESPVIAAGLLEDGRLNLSDLFIVKDTDSQTTELSLKAMISFRNARLSFDGLPQGLSAEASKTNGFVSFQQYPKLQVYAKGYLNEPAQSSFYADGLINIETTDISGRVEISDAKAEDLVQIGLIPEEYRQITGLVSASAAGSYSGGTFTVNDARLVIKNGSFAHDILPMDLEDITINASYDGQYIKVQKGAARAGATQLELLGTVNMADFQNPSFEDLTLKASDVTWHEWSHLVPLADWELDGLIAAEITAQGPLAAPAFKGRVEIENGFVHNLPLDIEVKNISAKAVLADDTVEIQKLQAVWQDTKFVAEGKAGNLEEPWMDLALSAAELDLQQIAAFIPGVANYQIHGKGSLTAKLGGTAKSPDIRAEAVIPEGSVMSEPFRDMELMAQYIGKRVDLELAAEAVEGQITGWGSWWPLSSGGLDLMGELQLEGIDAVRAAQLITPQQPLSGGKLAGNFVIKTDGSAVPRIYGTASLLDASIADHQLGPVELAFNYTDAIINLESLLLSYGEGLVSARGQIDAAGNLNLKGSGGHIELDNILAAIGVPAAGIAEFSFELGGTWESPAVSGKFTVSQATYNKYRLGTLEATVSLDGTQLAVKDCTLVHPQHQAAITGVYDLSSKQVQATLRAQGLQLDQAKQAFNLEGLNIAGKAGIYAKMSGQIDQPLIEANVSAESVRIDAEMLDKLDVNVSWDGQRVTITNGVIKKDSGTAELSGSYDSSGEVGGVVAIRNLELSGLEILRRSSIDLKGVAALDGRISGTIAQPSFRGNLIGENIAFSNVLLGAVKGKVAWENNRLELDEFKFVKADQNIVAFGWIAPGTEASIDVQLRSERSELADVLKLVGAEPNFSLRGLLTGTVHLSGPLARIEGSMTARVDRGRVANAELDASTDTSFIIETGSDGRISLSALEVKDLQMWQEKGELSASGSYDTVNGTDLAIAAHNFDIFPVMTLLDFEENLTGTGDVKLKLSGYPKNPRLTGDLMLTDGKLIGIDFDHLQGNARADAKALHFTEVRLERNGDIVFGEGTIPLSSSIRQALMIPEPATNEDMLLSLDISSDSVAIDWLPVVIYKDLKINNGRMAAKLHLGGTFERLDMQGTFQIKNGGFEIPGLLIPFTNAEGKGRFVGDRLIFDEFSAQYGTGHLQAGGSITMKSFLVERLDLWVKTDELLYASPAFTGIISGSAFYRGESGAMVLGGDVTVSDARVSYVPAEADPATNAEPATTTEDPVPPTGLDFKVKIGSEVRIKQSMTVLDVDVPVEGNLTVRGTLSEPKLSGQITASRGTVVAYRNAFQVMEAHAEFTEQRGYIPYIRVLARKPAEQAIVYLRAEGEVGPNLRIQFESSPQMSTEEIFALLDLPEMLKGNGLMIQDVLDEGIYVVGKATIDTLTRNVAELLNVDEFSLVPRGSSLFRDGVELRVGKFLTPNLYLQYASFYEDGFIHKIGLDYYISPLSVLNLSYSSTGDFSFGFSIRVRF